ncbi:MAG: DNA cytosine methyltransferase [Thermoanaerobaculia bacterium]
MSLFQDKIHLMSGNTEVENTGYAQIPTGALGRDLAPATVVRPMLRAIDFFCGAGGMTHGLLAAGIDVLAGVDNHLPCKATYEHQNNNRRPSGNPPRFIHADISTLDPFEFAASIQVERSDDSLIFAGCSPCQFWSKVNTSRERSAKSKALLEHFRRFVDALRPGYIIVENVPGLQTRSDTSGLAAFLRFLDGASYTYDHETVAVCLYGVPQKRWRYLLLATRVSPSGIEPAISLPEPEAKAAGSFPENMKVKYYLGKQNGFQAIQAGFRCEEPPLHWAAKLSDSNLQRIRKTPSNGGSRATWSKDPELQIEAYRGKDDIFRDVYGRMSWDEPAPTITTRFNSLSNGRFGHPDEHRAISLREGAILQTFPMGYVFPPNFPETARQIGNAVPPELARRIGCRLTEHYRSIKAEGTLG